MPSKAKGLGSLKERRAVAFKALLPIQWFHGSALLCKCTSAYNYNYSDNLYVLKSQKIFLFNKFSAKHFVIKTSDKK